MDGYEVARRIRLYDTGGRMHLLALTGYAQDETRADARHASFDHHLTKPVEWERLQSILASLLRSD